MKHWELTFACEIYFEFLNFRKVGLGPISAIRDSEYTYFGT